MRKSIFAVLFGASLAIVAHTQAATNTYVLSLDGSQEVLPNVGDPDGFGTATLNVDTVALTIDWNITTNNITGPVTGSHIHQAAAGVNGGIVIDFSGQLSGTGLSDPDIANLLANPAGFYVNVHNNDHPGGAIRGQIPEPSTFVLVGLALTGMVALRRR
jgi:hypothetical protein